MGSIDLFAAFILFGAIQGVLLTVAINRLPQRNKTANRVLSVFILLISFTLIWRITKTAGIVQVVMGIVQDIVIFLYGPIFYLYVQVLLTTAHPPFKKWRVHLIPALVYLCAIPPMYFAKDFWIFIYVATAFLAIAHSGYYLIKGYQLIRNFRKKNTTKELYTRYLQTIIALVGLCSLMALYATILFVFELPQYRLEFFNYNIAWLILAFITYTLGYFAMFTPEIFKVAVEEVAPKTLFSPKPVPAKKELNEADLTHWKNQLTQVMQTEQPYLNPKLTLADLAELMELDKLLVSRIIHEGFALNFHDYINTYRIDHFVELSQNEAFQHYTLLALAYEVGFNAKSTFHKAFKRLKNTSPKAYLDSLMAQ
ncbi:hypothetical protein BKI52_43795 [marine bacterium AO1-C]|nr:hypothetical protein BKI52_43795 [marine bacterium AO1-C]